MMPIWFFAATDSPAVNDAVGSRSPGPGIWVNRADNSESAPGNFITPAKFQSGSISVTVSAGSAALSAMDFAMDWRLAWIRHGQKWLMR